MTVQHTAPSAADFDAALLTRLGGSPADVFAAVEERVPAPHRVGQYGGGTGGG